MACLLVLLAHLPLAANSGAFWDGWILLTLGAQGDTGGIIAMYRDVIPLSGRTHALLQSLPEPVLVYRALYLVSLLALTSLAYWLLARVFRFDAADAALGAALGLMLPFSLVGFELVLLPIYFRLVAFFAGLALAYRMGLQPGRGASHLVVRFLLHACLLYGYLYYSLLPLHVLVLAVLAIGLERHRPGASLGGWARRAFAHGDVIAIPLVLWAARALWFAPRGLYEGQYDVALSAERVWAPVAGVFQLLARLGEVTGTVARPVEGLPWTPVDILPALAIALVAAVSLRPRDVVSARWLVAGAGVVFVCAVVSLAPFVLVGRRIDWTDWAGRHLIQVSLALGVLIAIVLRAAGQAGRGPQIAATAALLTVLLTVHWRAGAAWAIDDLKQKSLAANLAAMTCVQSADNVVFDDRAVAWNALARTYRFYDWSGILSAAFGDTRRFGLDRAEFEQSGALYAQAWWSQRRVYGLAEATGCGRTQVVTIEPAASPARLVPGYLLHRYRWDERFNADVAALLRVTCGGAIDQPCPGSSGSP